MSPYHESRHLNYRNFNTNNRRYFISTELQNKSSEIIITGIQIHKLQKYQNTNYKHIENKLHKYKLHKYQSKKYRNTNYRNKEILITLWKEYKSQEYKNAS